MSNRRPHVCFVAPNAYPLLAGTSDLKIVGGAELQQVMIARGLVSRGYRVSMICLNFGQADRLEIDGIVVHRAYRPTEGIPVLRFLWPRMTRIWSCLTRADADIYYQRAASVLTGFIAAHSRQHRCKSVFAVAGDPMIRFARDRWIYEYGIRNVDRIIVQNETQKEAVRNRFGRESMLIPNCFQPVPAGNRSPVTDVLWVSTIRQLKRPDRFLALAEALPQYRFTMIGGPGEGEAPLFDAIRRKSERLPNVEFVGFAPYAEADAWFEQARLFVNTSETEGFPNTFLQSWARRVPTISFIDCGARLKRRPIGLTVESLDELVRCVTDVLENDARRMELGTASETYVKQNHHPERVLDLYEDLFREIVGSR
ncbi:MAG TPA: glycosyltransferase family 4 protein [Woeseiaceae bacterium]|nr:glycosyltransferase family 4 protein [Woeseiaceae bacterium]